jgi:WD40 repeat protein
VVFSPDGSRVASGSGDNTVRVWDVQTGQCQHTLEGHSARVTSAVFSPDGSRVASGSWDHTVRAWDVQTGQCQHTLEGHSGGVTSAVFSPDGSRVASGSRDNTVRVWDVTSKTELLCYDTGIYLQKIEFTDNGTEIIVNGTLISILSQTRFPSTIARMLGLPPNLLATKLGVKGDWITLSSQRILWLPPEYRPGNWASKKDTIVIGSGTGRVTFVRYAVTHSSSL